MNPRIVLRSIALAALFLGAGSAHPADDAAIVAPSAQDAANKIAREIEQIRGLSFKQSVNVESQSIADFGEYVSRELDEAVPESDRSSYGIVVRALGLYRGPQIDDFSSMMTSVMTSQVGAYYDPKKQSFFVVMSGMPEMMQGVMYSHELYHALQDQYFDLTRYMEMGRKRGPHSHNADLQLALSAVVEGEATYMMSLWMLQKVTHNPPTREAMARVVAMQSNMSLDRLRQVMKQPEVAKMIGTDVQNAIESAGEIPTFIMDSMMAVYLKGLGFIFAVQEHGWSAVEELYAGHPPQSTEQILHPEKWFAREAPTTFAWPRFETLAALRDWELLDDDVLGEFQWRIVFKEHGFAAQAESAAAGWGGDRYAVFKRKDSDATLLLLRTRWDSETEAHEFADGYRRVMAVKFADAPVPTRLLQKGADVFIVEGGDERLIDSLLKIVKRVKPERE